MSKPPYKNPYTELVVAAREAAYKNSSGNFSSRSLQDLIDKDHVKGGNNLYTTWGPWALEAYEYEGKVGYMLYNEAADYEIVLDDITDIQEIFSWILHITGKDSYQYGRNATLHLGHAFQDIFRYSGINIPYCRKEFDGRKVAKKYYTAMQQSKRCVSVRTRHKVLERDRFRCQDCGASAANGAELEVDHTIPVSKGGSNDISNLRTLCKDCNRGKADRIVNYEPVSLFDSDT